MSVLIVVGVVWMIVAGTAVVKVRSEERVASVDGFQRQLRSFGGGPPPLPEPSASGAGPDNASIGRAPVIPALQGRLTPHRAQRLRRGLAALLIVALLTLVAAIVLSSRLVWGVHLLVDNALLAYVALLVRRRDAESPRTRTKTKTQTQAKAKVGRSRDGRRPPPSVFEEDDDYAEFRVLAPDGGGDNGNSKPTMVGATMVGAK